MKGTTFPRPFVKDPTTGAKRPIKGSTWTYAFSVTRAEGKRQQVTKGGFRTKGDAEAALSVALAEHGQGGPVKVEPSKTALSVYQVPLLRRGQGHRRGVHGVPIVLGRVHERRVRHRLLRPSGRIR